MITYSHTHRHIRPRASHRLLEPLEARTLLSAAILVAGNGVVLANQDITPAYSDFTDFGPTSIKVNAAIGVVSRSYIIADVGDTDLTLTGGARPIQISGAQAKEFVVTVNASTTIPVGMQSSFTISFVPKGVGLRRATVTIPSNDPAVPAFTFNIQGTAVKTATAANGLQVGIMAKGVGAGAVAGASITFNYTGFLLTTKFESTLDPGNAPLNLILGQSPVIPGWTQGFAGIKAGETRLLIVPAALAFGAAGSGSIPPNASLIYLVTALAVANPVVNISGNDIPIAFKDKTPDAADGTYIGATAAGSLAPLSFTFKITNGSAGKVAFPVLPVVYVVGKKTANFTVSGLTFDPSFDFATFTVTYTPTKAGTQSAVVHVRSTDPLRPDFTFTVAATTTPFLDLSPIAIGLINYPASGIIAAGATTLLKVPVTVSNFGNVAIPGQTAPVLLNFYLHDTTTGVDTLIYSQSVTNLRGTASGKSKLVVLNIALPVTIPAGTYQLLVKVNENAAVAETDFLNNSMLSSQIVSVT